jgi:hypothetical protein
MYEGGFPIKPLREKAIIDTHGTMKRAFKVLPSRTASYHSLPILQEKI